MSFPSISIITIFVPGQETALLATAESLFAKLGKDLEWEHCILTDEESVSATEKILSNQFRLPYPARVFASRQPNIFLARNEGVCSSLRDTIIFLQPGQRLLSKEVLQRVLSRLQNPEAAIAWAGWQEVRIGKNKIWPAPESLEIQPRYWQPGFLSAICFRREFFRKIGLFSPLYSCLGDAELLLRAESKPFRFYSVMGELTSGGESGWQRKHWENEWQRLFFQYRERFGWSALVHFRIALWQKNWWKEVRLRTMAKDVQRESRKATIARLWYR